MAAIRETRLIISPPTQEILNLIHIAAMDIWNDVNAATEIPLTALPPRESCKEIQREFRNNHQRLVRHGNSSAAAQILDPARVDVNGWVPQIFVMFEGSFGMPPGTVAVAIPIIKEMDPLIEYYCEGQVVTVDWKIGAMIYMQGDSSLASDGCGKTAFIFFLFKMK
ncbi:hypothetical protein sscle_11g081730 [Sclerotinia sclerotiorum 1980 UF-70]|uniref:Uncharacterized protein n=1 Tax=Sclerotinia sclerotiorum (strain ATCC 18683 / 1980 / Ss-1) TaxID=665079 RepID=A0A1D9QFL2_SCLS1|nr:hypothetical protein sscle_11g081730 [Sclerotinia sclerotiorum 1980 UF-70]